MHVKAQDLPTLSDRLVEIRSIYGLLPRNEAGSPVFSDALPWLEEFDEDERSHIIECMVGMRLAESEGYIVGKPKPKTG